MRREGSQERISHSFTTKLQYEMSTGGGRAPRAKRAFFHYFIQEYNQKCILEGERRPESISHLFSKREQAAMYGWRQQWAMEGEGKESITLIRNVYWMAEGVKRAFLISFE